MKELAVDEIAVLLLIICFCLGVGNFAMHRAVVESDHSFVKDTKLYFGKYMGRYGSYMIEFIMLAGAMYMASIGSILILMFYGIYTLFNGVAAYLLLSGKV